MQGRVEKFTDKINFMPKRRIFIAVQVSDELKNAAEAYLGPFFDDRNIRIPKREGWHITVVFCGYLDNKEVEVLAEIIKDICSKSQSFEFTPQKILFASPSRPRMIWLTFKNSSQFADLKNKIEDAMISRQSEGLFKYFRKEMREPNIHLTLGRFEENYFQQIKNVLPREGIDLSNETNPFPVKNIDIIESHLSRKGADYELVEHVNLE